MKKHILLILLFVLLLSFVPRFAGLNHDMLSGDANHWLKRSLFFSRALYERNFEQTFQSGHPGVTRMWLSGGVMSVYMIFSLWKDKKFKNVVRISKLGYFKIFKYFPNLIYLAKLSGVVVISLSIPLIFFLLKEMVSQEISILASILIALDPFYVAHSRLIHVDALMANFMIISLLSLLVFMKNTQKKYFVLSAIAEGLALLTKSPAIFLIPFVIMILFLFLGCFDNDLVKGGSRFFKGCSVLFICYIILVASTFFIFFPAMWVSPFETLNKSIFLTIKSVSLETFGGINKSQILGNFFMGRIVADPGWLFYPIAILFRLTPITLIGSLLCVIFLILGYVSREVKVYVNILILFILFFIIQMSLSAKKFDRYILPVFLVFDILAGIGIIILKDIVVGKLFIKKRVDIFADKNLMSYSFTKIVNLFLMLSIIFMYSVSLFTLHPNYLAYYNQLIGGGKEASKILFVGIGEGLREAADYLNVKPNAKDITVASWNGSEFAHFFKGRSLMLERFDKNNNQFGGSEELPSEVDYIVIYINQVQRNLVPKILDEYYRKKTPEYVVTINGINYAWIFKKQQTS